MTRKAPHSPLRKFFRTFGPPLAIGFGVLAVAVLAAGTLAAVILGDEIGDTANDLLQETAWFSDAG